MDIIFRDEDLYTIEKTKYEEKYRDNGYGFYCELDVYDIENNTFEKEIKYNKKIIEQQIKNELLNHYAKKYKQYADYCMFGLIVFSCSMLLF